MKLHLREDDSDEDTLIESLIGAAESYTETYTRRALLSQQFKMYLDCFPSSALAIFLPRSPLISLDEIAYTDENGDAPTMNLTTEVQVDEIDSAPPRITLKNQQSWPNTLLEANAVSITFTVGYGTLTTDIPKALIAAMKLLVATWFENRENIAAGFPVSVIPFTATTLLDTERIYEVKVDP